MLVPLRDDLSEGFATLGTRSVHGCKNESISNIAAPPPFGTCLWFASLVIGVNCKHRKSCTTLKSSVPLYQEMNNVKTWSCLISLEHFYTFWCC